MPVSLLSAKRLCTKNELALVKNSRPRQAQALTHNKLRKNAEQASSLAEHYAQLAQQALGPTWGQTSKASAKPAAGTSGLSTVDLKRKAMLFGECSERYQQEIANRD